jgi:acyl-CoA synthetase (NDP forming)
LRKIIPFTASSKNPVDVTFAVDMTNLIMKLIPRLLLSSTEIDGLLLYGIFTSQVFARYALEMGTDLPFTSENMRDFDKAMAERFAGIPKKFGKPIVGATFFTRDDDEMIRDLQDRGIPMLPSSERAASAMNALYRYGRIREKLANNSSPWDE